MKYNKLVRDKIPFIIGRDKCEYDYVRGTEYYKKLLDKLEEETTEILKNDTLEEYVDLYEVIRALVNYNGYTLQDFEKARKQKEQERGAFKDGIILIEVKDDE